MKDSKRTVISGPAISIRGNDIDTDRIIPARFLKTVVFDGLGEHAFADDRAQMKAQGEAHPFDDSKFENARILLVNKNFGCGSSREHAPQALMRWKKGIYAIIGESFAEIFFANCTALGIPCVNAAADQVANLMNLCEADPTATVTVDLVESKVSAVDMTVRISLSDGIRQMLLSGRWDVTAELLAAKDDIAYTAKRLPYFNGW